MTENSEVSYSTTFEISTNRLIEKPLYGFELQETEIEKYECTKIYKTKNEAIDAMILRLQSLKT